MLRKSLFAGLAMAGLALPQTAGAAEHIVFITETGFFPEVVYVDNGDTVKFVNDDDDAHKLQNEEAEWETTVINTAHSDSITAVQGMNTTYFSDKAGHASGVISFAEPPLD